MILDQFTKILESEGLKKIETENKEFDPATMDCSETVEGEKNKVIESISDGYYLYEKVLRPAKVKVGNGIIPSTSQDTNQDVNSSPPVIARSEATKQSI